MVETTQVPPLFLALFAVTFVVNAAYIGSLFLLGSRLRAPQVAAKGDVSVTSWTEDPVAGLKLLKFAFSSRHRDIGDATTSQLVMVVRALFSLGLPLTLGVFGYLASIFMGGAN
ncbi:MAG TPA: hypothetical protein VN018_07080 [Brevundimonas sp.]|nr:hypothetical protein [Brevundimonas sp.]